MSQMTPREALKNLDKSEKALAWELPTTVYLAHESIYRSVMESFIMPLVEKSEPIVPNDIQEVEDEPSVGICKCGYQVNSSEHYCSSCGQALKWEEQK